MLDITTSTYNGLSVDEYGDVFFRNYQYDFGWDGYFNVDTLTTNAQPLYITTDGASGANDNIIIEPNGTGNVGIGNSNPQDKLDISGPNQSLGSTNGVLGLYTTDSQAADKGGSIVLGGQDGTIVNRTFTVIAAFKENNTSSNYAGYLAFAIRPNGSGPAEAMRIASSGYVGIGTNAPAAPLTVAPPASQTVTAGATITGNACSTIKPVTSTAARSTSTTNAFTNSTAAGCCMHVFNVGTFTITLKHSANFKTSGAPTCR